MKKPEFRQGGIATASLRLIVLVPLGWMLFVALIPDFLMRVSGVSFPSLRAVTIGSGIIMLSGATAFLLAQIRKEKGLIVLVVVGTILLLCSQSMRILASMDIVDLKDVLRAWDNLLNGVGLLLIALAFFNTLIESWAAQQRLTEDHLRITREVERRKEVEESLRASEATLKAISASALDAIILMDNEGLAYYWNPSAERILGYSESDILGKPVHEVLVPACYREQYSRGLREWRSSGQGAVIGTTMPLKALRKDGVEIDVEISVASVQIRNQWFAVGILRDVTERKKTEMEVLRAKQRYVDLMNNIPVAIYRNTPEPGGRFVEMNPAHISMFEADSKEDFVAHGVSNLYRNPSDRKTLSDRLMKDGFIRNEEIALRTLKGRPIWGSVSAVLQRDESGNVFFDGIVEDITERKKAQEEYKAILGSAMDGFWLIDSDGRFLDVNQAYCEFSGYSREELLDMRVGDVEANESQAEVAEHIRRIMEKGHDRFETRHRRKDGLIIDVEVSVSRPKGSEGRQFAFLRDISEKKRSEEALLASEARYRDLVQNANTIIIRLDVDGRIKFFNEFAQQFFSFEEHEIVGQNILGTILPRSGESGKDLAALLRNSERHPDHFLDSEYEIVGRDGKRAWIAWTSTPVYDAEGTIKELLCVGNDVTERVNAERVIDDQRARMMNTSRLSAIGTMASGIAHEINNPLATISAATQQMGTILNSESPDRNRLTKIADVVERNVNRISRIVRGLKMLARDGAFDPFTKVSVANLILETLELCQARLAAHGISLILPDIPCHLTIECIPSQISQVILNLFNNAHDAVEDLPEKWIRLDVLDEGDRVAIAVTDSGFGLPPDVREKILVPFFTTKEPGKGVGLGLSISMRLMNAHNGELSVDDECPNTRFVVRLPKEQPKSNGASV